MEEDEGQLHEIQKLIEFVLEKCRRIEKRIDEVLNHNPYQG